MTIQTFALTCKFNQFYAVRELELQVPEGACFGFLGPNGAGKSTTLKMLTGLLQPTSGRVEILGLDIWKHPVEVKRQIGVVPEKLSLFERLTAVEYLTFVGAMYGLAPKVVADRTHELLGLMLLTERQDVLIADYSHGMRKKLALAASLIHNPRVLFLDEPFEGVDAISGKILRDLLLGLQARKVTIFITSHILEMIEKLCDQLGIIHNGQLISAGPMQDILSRLSGEGPSGTGSLEEAFIQMIGQEQSQHTLSWI